MESLLDFIQAVVWPIVILVVVIIFRKPILNLAHETTMARQDY